MGPSANARPPLRLHTNTDELTGVANSRFIMRQGLAQLSEGDQDLPALFSRADKAIYQAKLNGCNRVEAAS